VNGESAAPEPSRLGLLLRELAPSPDRWRASLRLAFAATLATGLVMFLHIPYGDFLIVLLFLVAGSETWFSPWRAGWQLAGVAAGSLVVVLSLAAFAEKPWVLFPLQGMMLGLVVFVSRTSAVPFGVSLVAVCFLLAVPEFVDAPETVLDNALWKLTMIALGVVGGTLTEAAVWRQHPEDALLEDLARRLGLVEEVLERALGQPVPVPPRWRGLVEATGIARQLQLLAAAEQDSPSLRLRHTQQLKLITELQIFVRGALDLERALGPAAATSVLTPALLERMRGVRGAAAEARRALLTRRPGEASRGAPAAAPPVPAGPQPVSEIRLALDQMEEALGAMGELLGPVLRPEAEGGETRAWASAARPLRSVLTPGFSLRNSDEIHVAIKAALTASLCGFIYEALHAPGISACVFAVLLLAQGTVGASVQRSVVQISGAVLGAAYALLALTLMPSMTSIASLMPVVFPLFLAVAWLSYGGGVTAGASLQMAMAGCLVLLPALGPTKDLGPAAGRVVGVLLANVVFGILNLTLWPAYAGSPARLSRIVRQLAQLQRLVPGGDWVHIRAQIFDIHRSLAVALARQDEARFEPLGRSPAAPLEREMLFSLVRHLQDVFQALLAVARARRVLDAGRLPGAAGEAVAALESAVASRLALHADCLERGVPAEMAPLGSHLDRLAAATGGGQGGGGPDLEAFVLRARRLVAEVTALEEVVRRYAAVLRRRPPAVQPLPEPAPR